jgi:hypothetical protein
MAHVRRNVGAVEWSNNTVKKCICWLFVKYRVSNVQRLSHTEHTDYKTDLHSSSYLQLKYPSKLSADSHLLMCLMLSFNTFNVLHNIKLVHLSPLHMYEYIYFQITALLLVNMYIIKMK